MLPPDHKDFKGNLYPVSHWSELRRFHEGEERDPKGIFRLADDMWDAWQYAGNGRPTEAEKYRYRFGYLTSCLKPYIKLYCYEDLIGSGGSLKSGAPALPYRIAPADRFMIEHGYRSLDDLASPDVFENLWKTLLRLPQDYEETGERVPGSAVLLQLVTRPFWQELQARFGSPTYIPPIHPHRKRTPTESGGDETKVIPDVVIRQLVNILALHRRRISQLNRFHHLRLCVLLLLICLGRRVDELLSTPRGEGSHGPLERYPCRHQDGEQEDGLWFIFCPNKNGPSDAVYISPEWENIATYCVRELIKYGDEVRHLAPPEEQDLLILVSTWNWTSRQRACSANVTDENCDFTRRGILGGPPILRPRLMKKRTTALKYSSFRWWLSGKENLKDAEKSLHGVLQEWKITEDGSADGPIYRLHTHQGRHTRQSALTLDPEIPLLVRQRDLNHRNPNMQFAYQHTLDEQNEGLIMKATEVLQGEKGGNWLNEVLSISDSESESRRETNYRPGLVQLITPRQRKLLENSWTYVEKNKVPLGLCLDPDGPDGCDTYPKDSKGAGKKKVAKRAKERKGRGSAQSPPHEVHVSERAAVKDPYPQEPRSTSVDVTLNKLREKRRKMEESGL